MPEHGIRNAHSRCPFEIQMYDDHGHISSGTAFFYEIEDDWYLITNWHNISGKHFLTHEPLSPERRLPTRLVSKLATHTIGTEEDQFGIGPFRYAHLPPRWPRAPLVRPSNSWFRLRHHRSTHETP